MKKLMMFIMALSFMLAASSQARKARGDEESSGSSRGGIQTGMAGKWGLGFETMSGGVGAADVRYWLSDTLGLEGNLGLDWASQPGGTDSAGKPTNNSSSAIALGVGAKFNWKKPVEDVLIQFLGRAILANQSQTTVAAGNSTSLNTLAFGIFVGTGFEAFIPVWRSLSVEGNVGINLGITSISSNAAGSTSQSGSSFGIIGNGFAPTTVAIHYYF
jgi:hypothetical protein